MTRKRKPPGTILDHGDRYQPAIQAHDIRSPHSKRTRIWGVKTHRFHHLLSQLECSVYFQAERDGRVKDIQEQCELNRDETVMIAARLGYRHPAGQHAMTSDFIITVVAHDGSTRQIAIHVKHASKLSRNMEWINVEAYYWSAMGIPLYVITELDIEAEVIHNGQWLYFVNTAEFDRLSALPNFGEIVSSLTAYVTSGRKLSMACEQAERDYGLPPNSGLLMAKVLIRERGWVTDLSVRIRLGRPLVLLEDRTQEWLKEVTNRETATA